MLSPDYLSNIPEDFLKIFLNVENSIIEDMARRIIKAGKFTGTAQWQRERLQAINASYDYVMQQLEQQTGRTQGELRKLFQDAGAEALEYDNQVYRYAGLAPKAIEDSPLLRQQLLTAYQNTQGNFKNLTRTTASASQKQFIDTLDHAALQLQSGAFSYTQVITQAIKSVAQDGVWAIQYPTGHVDKLDVATRRAVLTGVNQMAGKLSIAQMDDMDCDLVETTAHAGARPSHQVWQGKVFSRGRRNSHYPDFVSSTGYGSGGGLCGWNCRHSFFPYFEGLSQSAYPRSKLKEYEEKSVEYNGQTLKYYDATQMQRGLERRIRATKRELTGYSAGMKAGGQDVRNALQDQFNAASVKLKRQEAKLKDFTRQTGLDRQREREQALGFGQSTAQKAVQANKKIAVQKQNAIIESEIKKATGIRGELSINPRKIDLSTLSFDSEHANQQSGHNVTEQEAKEFIENAKATLTRWNGKFVNYYSEAGAAYVDTETNTIRTAFKSGEFDPMTKSLMRGLKKHGK